MPPGNHVLVIDESEGWEGLRVPLRVAVGEITDVLVDLRRKDRE